MGMREEKSSKVAWQTRVCLFLEMSGINSESHAHTNLMHTHR